MLLALLADAAPLCTSGFDQHVSLAAHLCKLHVQSLLQQLVYRCCFGSQCVGYYACTLCTLHA